MRTTPTVKDLGLGTVDAMVATFCTTQYDVSDPEYDPTLPALWAWAVLAEYAADKAVASMAIAQDAGYTLQEIGESIGVTKQAVGQRLLRATRPPIRKDAPKSSHPRLFP